MANILIVEDEKICRKSLLSIFAVVVSICFTADDGVDRFDDIEK
ncbi:MAG: hypothetical protein ACLR1T_05500 [Evtepia gabavorous]